MEAEICFIDTTNTNTNTSFPSFWNTGKLAITSMETQVQAGELMQITISAYILPNEAQRFQDHILCRDLSARTVGECSIQELFRAIQERVQQEG